MKKSTTTTFHLQNILIVILAFIIGTMIYFFGAIALDRLTPVANAASGVFQQVTVKVTACNCITEFKPDPMLDGDGIQEDPYISNNISVDIAFKVNGVGQITIEDENGNILYRYNQTSSNEPEKNAQIIFPSAGDHKLIIKLDGTEVSMNGVSTELYFRIGKLQPILPDLSLPGVPNTGNYIYIGGYAVQTYSLILSGIVASVLAVIILFFFRRRQHRSETSVRTFVNKTSRKTSHKKRP